MPLFLIRNDITRLRVDAIVNAANRSLLGGGGVDGAIHRAAGPELVRECAGLGGCETGEAKATGAYNLPTKYVIHTVGPIWRGGDNGEHELLESCYRNSLALAEELGCQSVAFPLISSGAYGYPVKEAFRTAVDTVLAHLENSDITVYLVLFGRAEFTVGSRAFGDIASYIDENFDGPDFEERRRERRRLWEREYRAERADEPDACWCEPSGHARPYPREKAKLASHRPRKPDWDAAYTLDDEDSLAAEEEPSSAPAEPENEAFKPDASAAVPHSGRPPRPAYSFAQTGAAPNQSAVNSSVGIPGSANADASDTADISRILESLDESFSQMLLRKIDESGLTDSQCYRRANIDRKLFSKIRADKYYRPSKPTAFAFAIALRLSLEETSDLLGKAGFAISHSSKFDLIIEYYIKHGKYDIYEINETLFAYDQPLLGNAG